MNKREMEKIVAEELKQFAPKELPEIELGLWRMWFNALRQNDLAKQQPSQGKTIAIRALFDTLLRGKSDSYEVIPVENTRLVTVICTNPKEDIKWLLSSAIGSYSLLKGCIVDEILNKTIPQGLTVTKLEIQVPD